VSPRGEEVERELQRLEAGGSEHKGHSLEEHRPAVRRMLANRLVLRSLLDRATKVASRKRD